MTQRPGPEDQWKTKKEENHLDSEISDQPVEKGDERAKPDDPNASQVYIGLVIGVLAVTVILLLATIMVMLRKNRQRIFSKNSVFKSPLSDRHAMRDMMMATNHPPEGASKIYEEAKESEGYAVFQHPEQITRRQHPTLSSSATYKEPSYRFVLRKSPHDGSRLDGTAYQRNSSCGRLCDYEEPLINSAAGQNMRLPSKVYKRP